MTSQGELLVRVLLGLGAVLVVPVALPLLGAVPTRPIARASAWLLRFGSVGLGAALMIGSGPIAVALALPWTIGAAAQAVVRLHTAARDVSLDRLVAAIATVWLAMAGMWMCFALTGPGAPATPAYLRWPTPAHFLYAGFALTTIAATLHRTRRTTATTVAMFGVLGGMPLLAIEIGFAPSAQWTGALLIGTAALLVAIQQLIAAVTAVPRRAANLLRASSAALGAAMVLAIGYGLSTRFGFTWLSLDAMAAIHGVLNTFGFAMLAVVGWRITTTTTSDERHPAHEQLAADEQLGGRT